MDIFRLVGGSRLKYSAFVLNCSIVGVHEYIFVSDSEQLPECYALFRYLLKTLPTFRLGLDHSLRLDGLSLHTPPQTRNRTGIAHENSMYISSDTR